MRNGGATDLIGKYYHREENGGGLLLRRRDSKCFGCTYLQKCCLSSARERHMRYVKSCCLLVLLRLASMIVTAAILFWRT